LYEKNPIAGSEDWKILLEFVGIGWNDPQSQTGISFK